MITGKIENVTIEMHNEDGDEFVVIRIDDRPGFNFILEQQEGNHVLDADEFLEMIQIYDEDANM